MPMIRPSSDLRNKYSEISDYCHQNAEAIFLTKNGHGDLVVMSIEKYEQLTAHTELELALSKGLQDVRENRTKPANTVFSNLKAKLKA